MEDNSDFLSLNLGFLQNRTQWRQMAVASGGGGG